MDQAHTQATNLFLLVPQIYGNLRVDTVYINNPQPI